MIEGYASLFGVPDRAGDVIAPGAFRRTLSRRRAGALPLLWQHRPDEVLGRIVYIAEDRRGLFVRAALEGGVARAREALALMRSRTLTGLSIGFRPVRARALKHGQRLLTEIELWEVSLVTFPMLDGARVLRVAGASKHLSSPDGAFPISPEMRRSEDLPPHTRRYRSGSPRAPQEVFRSPLRSARG